MNSLRDLCASVVYILFLHFNWVNSYVSSLRNNKYFIFYTIGCLPGKFEISDSIGEHFVFNPEGGAVAFVGNSRYGWYEQGNAKAYSGEYDVEFFRRLFSERITNIGRTLAFSKISFISVSNADNPYRWAQFCLNLLGDPEMPVHIPPYDLTGEIIYPSPDQDLSGVVEIRGRVGGADFESYSLEYFDTEWHLIYESKAPASGTLCYWDTSKLDPGLYKLRLSVKSIQGIEGSREKSYWVDNRKFHPGWPVRLDGRCFSPPTFADVNNDGEAEIAIAVLNARDYKFVLYLFNHKGEILPGWPKEIYANTMGMYVLEIHSFPSLGDIDGDGDMEIVFLSQDHIYAYHYDGRDVEGFPIEVCCGVNNGPALCNIDSDPALEIVFIQSNYLCVIKGDGKLLWYRPKQDEAGSAYLYPGVGDVDGDGDVEIAFSGYSMAWDTNLYLFHHTGEKVSGWPRQNISGIPPVLADFDGNGSYEMVAGASKIHILHHEWEAFPGWPQSLDYWTSMAPHSVADIDSDSDLEVLVSDAKGRPYAFHHTGKLVSGFPVELKDTYNVRASPTVADIDGDGKKEIFIGECGFSVAGTVLPGFPFKTKSHAFVSPIFGDMDNDGKNEMLLIADRTAYLIDTEGKPKDVEWQFFGQDSCHTGVYPRKETFKLSCPNLVKEMEEFEVEITAPNFSGDLLISVNTGEIVPGSATISEKKRLNLLIKKAGEPVFIKVTDASNPKRYGLSNPISVRKDLQPPNRIEDLSVTKKGCDFIELSWTASGDDGGVGKAGLYDLRYSKEPIDQKAWCRAKKVDTPPILSASGEKEVFTIKPIASNSTYYIGLRVIDTASNTSPLSNIVVATTTSGRITLTYPTSGIIKDLVRIEGADFIPTEIIRIDFGTTETMATTRASQKGTFSVTFYVNTQDIGTLPIKVIGLSSGDIAITWFYILPLYYIKGRVLDWKGDGIQGVLIFMTGQQSGLGSSKQDGSYEFLQVKEGWRRLSPVKTGYRFLPDYRIYDPLNSNLENQDFIGYTTYLNIYPLGDSLMVSGYGFGKTEEVYIDFGTTKSITKTASDSKGFFSTTFIVSSQPVETVIIVARGITSGLSATASFVILIPSKTQFVEGSLDLPLLWVYPDLTFGDYNQDGYPDLAIAGENWSERDIVTKIFKNNKGSFTDIKADLTGVMMCSLLWSDYDNDSDLDLIVSGFALNNGTKTNSDTDFSFLYGDEDISTEKLASLTATMSMITKIYRNDNGLFVDSKIKVMGIIEGNIDSADLDSDGDLEIIIGGESQEAVLWDECRVYRNEKGSFTETAINLYATSEGVISCADYDGDLDTDIFISGEDLSDYITTFHSTLYKNDNNRFIDTKMGIEEVKRSDACWGDYDNDGDLDLAISGRLIGMAKTKITKLYRNDSGSLVDTNITFTGTSWSSLKWIDYDNDGDLDLLACGYITDRDLLTRIYENRDGKFFERDFGFLGMHAGGMDIADVDLDGDLDIAMMGWHMYPFYKLYLNQEADALLGGGGANPNRMPEPPTQLSYEMQDGFVILSWNQGKDEETPEKGLYYTIRLGTKPSSEEIVPPYSGSSFGRYIKTRSTKLKLPPGRYYCAVQTVDTGLLRSAWSSEKIFDINPYLSIIPGSGPVGTVVTLSGIGFGKNEKIEIGFGDIPSFSYSFTDDFGSFRKVLLVSQQTQGQKMVVGNGKTSKIRLTTTFLTTPGAICKVVESFPCSGINKGTKTLTILGKNFLSPDLLLIKGDRKIPSYKITASPERIIASFDLNEAEPGLYDIVVVQGDSSFSLRSCFTINRALTPPLIWEKDTIFSVLSYFKWVNQLYYSPIFL